MFGSKLVMLLTSLALLNFSVSTCRSGKESGGGQAPSADPPKVVTLEGVDSSELTNRESTQWSSHVSELLAPCKTHPVTLAECVGQKRDCASCLPAAKYVMQQVQRGLTEGQVEAAYRTRFGPDQVKQLDLSGSPSKGSSNAPVTLVEWADFECPACRAAKPLFEELLKKYPGQIRLVFKHFPLAVHENAEKAARAAVAADKQGKFWEMHHALFEAEPPLSPPNLVRLAEKLKLDVARFKSDFDSEAVADAVARDKKQGETVGLTGTPTIYINGRRFISPGDMQADLEEWIALELELSKKAPANKVAPSPSSK